MKQPHLWVSAPTPSGPSRLSHTGRTQTPLFCCPVVPLPYVQLKLKKIARDNYTIKALFTVVIITQNIFAYFRIKSTFLCINEQLLYVVGNVCIWSIISLHFLNPLSKNILDSAMHSYIINNFMKADLNTQHQGGCGTAFLKFHETRNFDENILNFAKFCEIW